MSTAIVLTRKCWAGVGSQSTITRTSAAGLQRHPRGRMVARFFLAAYPGVDVRIHETGGERLAEQQVIDAQARIALPVIAEVVPEGIDPLLRMAGANRIEPPLLEQSLIRVPRLGLQQRVLAP